MSTFRLTLQEEGGDGKPLMDIANIPEDKVRTLAAFIQRHMHIGIAVAGAVKAAQGIRESLDGLGDIMALLEDPAPRRRKVAKGKR